MQLFVTNKMHCDFLCGRQKACLSAEFGKLGNGEQGSYGAWKSLNSMEFHLLKIKALKAWNFINWHGKPGILTQVVFLMADGHRIFVRQVVPHVVHAWIQP